MTVDFLQQVSDAVTVTRGDYTSTTLTLEYRYASSVVSLMLSVLVGLIILVKWSIC